MCVCVWVSVWLSACLRWLYWYPARASLSAAAKFVSYYYYYYSAASGAVSSKLNASGCPTRCLYAFPLPPCFPSTRRLSVCLAVLGPGPAWLGLANALATNSSNLAQNWRLMTYVWHIAKLGDLMKFIIVLVYIPIYGVSCAMALTKASAGRTNGSPQASSVLPHSSTAVKVYVQFLRLLQQLFLGQLLLYGQ